MIQLTEKERFFLRAAFTAAVARDIELQSPLSWGFQALGVRAVEVGDAIFSQFMASSEASVFPPSLRQIIQFAEAWARLSYVEREQILAEAVAVDLYEPTQVEYLLFQVLSNSEEGGQTNDPS